MDIISPCSSPGKGGARGQAWISDELHEEEERLLTQEEARESTGRDDREASQDDEDRGASIGVAPLRAQRRSFLSLVLILANIAVFIGVFDLLVKTRRRHEVSAIQGLPIVLHLLLIPVPFTVHYYQRNTPVIVEEVPAEEVPTTRYTGIVCPSDYRPHQDKRKDPLGSRPLLCTYYANETVPFSFLGFQVVVSHPTPWSMIVQVNHTGGFTDTPETRYYETGPDYITIQLVGPELRHVVMQNIGGKGSSLYESVVEAALPGEYVFDVTVLYAHVTLESYCLKRNLLLVSNQPWSVPKASPAERRRDYDMTRLETPGRWLRLQDLPESERTVSRVHYDKDFLVNRTSEDLYVAHRCEHLGEYAWTPRVDKVSSAARLFNSSEAIVDCLRSASRLNRNYTRFVMAGDSQSRTSLNGLLRMIWANDPHMQAQKSFKSVNIGQCYGGPSYGVEICFQWQPWGNIEQVKKMMEEYDYVTVNIGHWPMGDRYSREQYAEVMDPYLQGMQSLIDTNEHRGYRSRLAWFESPLAPQGNDWWVEGRNDGRCLTRIYQLNKYVSQQLARRNITEIKVDGMVLPYHDCSVDATHYAFGIPETIMLEKVLPWICPVDDSRPQTRQPAIRDKEV